MSLLWLTVSKKRPSRGQLHTVAGINYLLRSPRASWHPSSRTEAEAPRGELAFSRWESGFADGLLHHTVYDRGNAHRRILPAWVFLFYWVRRYEPSRKERIRAFVSQDPWKHFMTSCRYRHSPYYAELLCRRLSRFSRMRSNRCLSNGTSTMLSSHIHMTVCVLPHILRIPSYLSVGSP